MSDRTLALRLRTGCQMHFGLGLQALVACVGTLAAVEHVKPTDPNAKPRRRTTMSFQKAGYLWRLKNGKLKERWMVLQVGTESTRWETGADLPSALSTLDACCIRSHSAAVGLVGCAAGWRA